MPRRPAALASFAFIALLSAGCIPYAYGRTAQPVPEGKRETQQTVWFMPNGVTLRDTVPKQGRTLYGFDAETRWGINDESDFGLRVPAGLGVVASYKRRVLGYPDPDSGALAWQLGGGIVNWGEHALGEFTLVANSPLRSGVAWYSGARVMQVSPLSDGAAHDSPTAGGFLGLRLKVGTEEFLPEIAVYHDRSALEIRHAEVIFVPSITIRSTSGFRLPGIFGRYWR